MSTVAIMAYPKGILTYPFGIGIFLLHTKGKTMELIYNLYSIFIAVFVCVVLVISGFSLYIYEELFTNPGGKIIGEILFGIGQSILAAIIYTVATDSYYEPISLVILLIFSIYILYFGSELKK